MDASSVKHIVLDLFSGMGGLTQAMVSLGLTPLLGKSLWVLMFEVDSRCRKLLSHHHSGAGRWLSPFPDSSGLVGSVFYLLEQFDSLCDFLSSAKGLLSVLVAGGSPCVGFSRAKQQR